MFAVIFEVQPKKERYDQYLELAKFLKPELERIDGFIDNERFASQKVEGRVLSLSTWRDEKSVIRWRTLAVHHGVQEKGRNEVFADYHLRVGEITTDTHVPAGQSVREQRLDTTEVGEAKTVTITEVVPHAGNELVADELNLLLGLPTGDSVLETHFFQSIYNPGKCLLLASWKGSTVPWAPPRSSKNVKEIRHRAVRVIRDYGMFDRREAPQYYPEVRSEQ
ncbi:MAG: antibiotic biosynthesis monooxygenase [Chthoniobacterales bacterium]